MGSRPTAMGLLSWRECEAAGGPRVGLVLFWAACLVLFGRRCLFWIFLYGKWIRGGPRTQASQARFGLVWYGLVSRFSTWTVRLVRRGYAYETVVGLIFVGEKRPEFFFDKNTTLY
jgi:hypothetical protein